VRIANVNGADRGHAVELLRAFAADVKSLGRPAVEEDLPPEPECALATAESQP
jgi:hypothetical protein